MGQLIFSITSRFCDQFSVFVDYLADFFSYKNIPYSIIYFWILHRYLSPEIIFFFLISMFNICVNICFNENPMQFFSAEYCLFLLPPHQPLPKYSKKKCIMIVAQVGVWEQDDMCPNV